jgi:hypothetical protein
MEISENIILDAFYMYSGQPSFNTYDQTYNAGCPICKEGKSWGRKKRLYYYPKTKSFYCFNCQKSWNAISWLIEVSGQSYEEILTKNKISDFGKEVKVEKLKKEFIISDLPYDSINILDPVQQNYYKNNKYFNIALEYIKKRKIDSAINKSKTLFLSLKDKIHKNRLIIPFYDSNNKIIFYQTRSLDKSEPRYLGKYGADKSVYGIEKIDESIEYIFLFEGPIDSMFVKNGVAVCGLTLTKTQKQQLKFFPLHKKIWILDNINIVSDEETKQKTLNLLNNSEKVFKWPKCKYKDFNELAIDKNLNEIPINFILKNLY